MLAIKQTLYRVGRNAPVVRSLLEAQRNGKQVAVLVELKARFDEESNIGWAKALEAAGVHVVYGLVGLKTHSKITLVVRKEEGGLRRYLHLATGNYNAVTAGIYTDCGLLTCDPDMGADATELFNTLTGYSTQRSYRNLLVAPGSMRERIEGLIEREIEHAKAGRGGQLIFKMNSLVDERLIRKLYQASQAGVQIDMIIRGICCLRPGLPGVSDNIRVTSIVGRFLEHSRIYYFGNGGAPEVYLGSADLMPRNLDRRVEIVFPVKDPGLRTYLRDGVLAVELANNTRARVLKAGGEYVCRDPLARRARSGQPGVADGAPPAGRPRHAVQEALSELATRRMTRPAEQVRVIRLSSASVILTTGQPRTPSARRRPSSRSSACRLRSHTCPRWSGRSGTSRPANRDRRQPG